MFARNSGLSCAPDKSEVITIHEKCYKINGNLSLEVDSHVIGEVTRARVLSFWVQSSDKAKHTFTTLKTTVKPIAIIIFRITNHRKRMRERVTITLVQARVLRRVAYGLPYPSLDKGEAGQVEV
ncbi:hypothetical protein HPB49_008012 [Dermacentor silvarum]|uniref:Uncharacterized protein n=1 Tax=Dermacentor silvarum TaxID=543639 RepID=A0ACB8CQP6_DERSI|nr:hypothetical protein HPB49_008012 [Dermacentor silvarum]